VLVLPATFAAVAVTIVYDAISKILLLLLFILILG